MKKLSTVIKEYVNGLTAEELDYLAVRLENRLGSDLSEVVKSFSSNQDLDKWLMSAKSADEFYDMVDAVQLVINKELDRQFA